MSPTVTGTLLYAVVLLNLPRNGASDHYAGKRKYIGHDEDSSASCEAVEGPCFVTRKTRVSTDLVRLDGVKVGHRQEIDLGDYGTKVMITRAMRPLLFEIPDFLSDEECDYLIAKADEEGMRTSIARGGLTELDHWKFHSSIRGRAEGPRGLHENWDFNKDGRITTDEIVQFARVQRYLYINESEVEEMFEKLGLAELDDGFISREEFEGMNTLLVDSYLYEMKRDHPRHRQRFSDQAWLTKEKGDLVLERLRRRNTKLTGLPEYIVKGSEYLQVARYGIDGHYHAHYDSETHEQPEVPCCHQVSFQDMETMEEKLCKLCRYITILYYLNDVPSGGETAFPVVDNATFDQEFLQSIRHKEDRWNLSEFCDKAMLVLKPRRRTAVMWYNHDIDPESGWMGERDVFSIHGGCGIKKGVKYIANNWIVAPYKHGAHMPSLYLIDKDNEM